MVITIHESNFKLIKIDNYEKIIHYRIRFDHQ